jgi:hypothetical protein
MARKPAFWGSTVKSHVRNLAIASAAATIALAFAAPANAGNHNPPSTDCGSYTKLENWWDVNGNYCIQGDKKFTILETNLNEDTDIDFSMSQDGLTHTFKVTEDLRSGSDDKTYYIKYSVEVLDPNYLITSVLLDSGMDYDDASADTTVTKKIYQDGNLIDTLVSTEGSDDTSIPLSADALVIKDYVFIPEKETYKVCVKFKSNGQCKEYDWVEKKDQLDWFQNVIVQTLKPPPPTTEVAEPETLAMFGLGLLGLGLLARRRKA